jgi:hypothetical protein
MDSATFVKDFASCISCERIVMITKPKLTNPNKKKPLNEPTFHVTVCYSCEADGAAVPQETGNKWTTNVPPSFYLSLSVLKTSVKFKAVNKMVESSLQFREQQGRVKVRHRNDILHGYETGCKIVSVNVYEHVDATAIECAHLDTGFF